MRSPIRYHVRRAFPKLCTVLVTWAGARSQSHTVVSSLDGTHNISQYVKCCSSTRQLRSDSGCSKQVLCTLREGPKHLEKVKKSCHDWLKLLEAILSLAPTPFQRLKMLQAICWHAVGRLPDKISEFVGCAQQRIVSFQCQVACKTRTLAKKSKNDACGNRASYSWWIGVRPLAKKDLLLLL